MGVASNVLGSAGKGAAIASVVPGIGTLAGAGIGALVGGVRSIGQGHKTANHFVQDYEDKLGKEILPQVIAMAQSGNTEGAKALLQKGVSDYYAGIGQFQAQGGHEGQVAGQSLSNTALHNTISTLGNSLGMQYTPGTGFASPAGLGGPYGAPGSEEAAKGALYGLGAPLAQGDPYALKPEQVIATPKLNETGYAPKVQAQMNAQAMEAPAAAGLQELSGAKRALSQNGLMSSPAAVALQQTVARQTGQNQVAAKRDVSIQNANVGMDNARTNNTNQINNQNLQTEYNWKAKSGNFDELNKRYNGAFTALAGG